MEAWEVGIMALELVAVIAALYTLDKGRHGMPRARFIGMLLCCGYLCWHAGKVWGAAQEDEAEVGEWVCLNGDCCMEAMLMPDGSYAYMRHYDCEGE
jgi:hypothetical protein